MSHPPQNMGAATAPTALRSPAMNSPLHTPRSIDASLARSIRRGYFRRLAHEWDAAARRRQRAAARSV